MSIGIVVITLGEDHLPFHLAAALAELVEHGLRASSPELPWAATVYNGMRVSDHDFRRDKDDFVLFIGRCCADKAPELAVRAARDASRKLVALTKCREPDEKDYFEQVVEPPLLGSDVEWLEEPRTAERRSNQGSQPSARSSAASASTPAATRASVMST
jgi:hypothetical protein